MPLPEQSRIIVHIPTDDKQNGEDDYDGYGLGKPVGGKVASTEGRNLRDIERAINEVPIYPEVIIERELGGGVIS